MCACEEFLTLFGDADEGVSGRSKLMKVGLRIGIRRLSADGGHSLLGQRECTDRERNRFCKL
jgi:hypothetical protein